MLYKAHSYDYDMVVSPSSAHAPTQRSQRCRTRTPCSCTCVSSSERLVRTSLAIFGCQLMPRSVNLYLHDGVTALRLALV